MPNNGGMGETCSGKHVEGNINFLNLPSAIMVSEQEHYQLLQQQEKHEKKTTQEHKLKRKQQQQQRNRWNNTLNLQH